MNLTSVSVSENIAFADLNVFPNPTSEILNIEFGQEMSDLIQIDLYDLTGKKVMSSQNNVSAGNNFLQINIAELESGIYFLNMNNTVSSVSISVIKK
jgi:hypothetical protein